MRQGAGPSRGGRGGGGNGGEGGAVAATKTRRLDADLARTPSVVTVVAADVATSRTRRGISSSAREIAVQRFFPPRRADLAHPSDVVKCILSLIPLFLSLYLSLFLSSSSSVCLSLSASPFFFLFTRVYLSFSISLYFSLASFVSCIIPM